VKVLDRIERTCVVDAALTLPVCLELAAWAAGVPMPRPYLVVESDAGAAAAFDLDLDPALIRVHDWVDGSAVAAPTSTRVAAELGAALAAIHGLDWGCGEGADVDAWYRAAHGAAHWGQLADRADRAGYGWARRLRAALPLLAEAEALVAARKAESVPLLVTHCDLVPGNVLKSPHGRLWIVDWDDAGPWNAAEEVSAAVVSWSSSATGAPIERTALAMVEGYRSAGGIFDSHPPTVLAGSLSAAANWLERTVRRSLSGAATQPVLSRAHNDIVGALTEFVRRLDNLDRWARLIG
jgi:Ser/Thr protein kinase RdoA (MazF antagonist)